LPLNCVVRLVHRKRTSKSSSNKTIIVILFFSILSSSYVMIGNSTPIVYAQGGGSDGGEQSPSPPAAIDTPQGQGGRPGPPPNTCPKGYVPSQLSGGPECIPDEVAHPTGGVRAGEGASNNTGEAGPSEQPTAGKCPDGQWNPKTHRCVSSGNLQAKRSRIAIATLTISTVGYLPRGLVRPAEDFSVAVYDNHGGRVGPFRGCPLPSQVEGGVIIPATGCNPQGARDYILAPGRYRITVTSGPPNYVVYMRGDCRGDGTGTIAAGERQFCTLNNVYTGGVGKGQALLVVTKHVIGGPSREKLRLQETYFNVIVNPPTHLATLAAYPIHVHLVGWVELFIIPGPYSIIESPLNPNYTPEYSRGCAGSIAERQATMCMITNHYTGGS
jgi:hypothetical protein